MAATLPSRIYISLDSTGDSYRSTTHGTYDSGVGSLTSHPYQYQTSSDVGNTTDSQQPSLYSNDYHQSTYSNGRYSKQQQALNTPTNKYTQQQLYNTPTNKYAQQPQPLNGYLNPQTSKSSDTSQATSNTNNTGSYATTKIRQPPQIKNMDNQHVESKNHQQNLYAGTTQHRPPVPVDNHQHRPVAPVDNHQHRPVAPVDNHQHRPPAPVDNQHYQPQSHLVRSEHQISSHAPKQEHHKSHPPPQSNLNQSEHQTANHASKQEHQIANHGSKQEHHKSQPPPQSNLSRSEHQTANHASKQEHQTANHGSKQEHHKSHPSSQSNLNRSEHQTANHASKQEHQIANHGSKQEHHKSQPPPQSNLNRSDHQTSKSRASSPPALPPVIHRSSSNSRNKEVSEAARKINNPSLELKPNKSSTMRAAAIKKKEETLEQKRKDKFFPVNQNKATPTKLKSQQTSPQTDAEQSDIEKTQQKKKQSNSLSKTQIKSHSDGEQTDTERTHRNKKKSHSQPKQHKTHLHSYQTEDNNNSSGDDDNHKHQRNKPQRRTTFSNSHLDKHSHLPPLRHGRIQPHHNPYLDYPLPPEHPLRGRFPYHADYPPYGSYPPDRYPLRHLHEDASNIPPYLAPYHDPYDPFFDYQKRKAKPKGNKDETNSHTNHENNGGMNGHETERDDGTKSQLSRKSTHKNANNGNGGRKSRHDHEENRRSHWPPGYNNETDNPLEAWRQERNDYLKKEFKPTIHDVLYSQQWMKSDSYVENQRRRALRDAQGYYFPYKKYTLKDYKDMQKLSQQNPFADVEEITIDRKELAKKRQEYGSLIERQVIDNPRTRQIPPREMTPRRPWHISNGEPHDPDVLSKRERALEYAKVQVKYRPVDPSKNPSSRSEPTEQYVNNLFPEMNDDDYRSNNQQTNKIHQSYDDYE